MHELDVLRTVISGERVLEPELADLPLGDLDDLALPVVLLELLELGPHGVLVLDLLHDLPLDHDLLDDVVQVEDVPPAAEVAVAEIEVEVGVELPAGADVGGDDLLGVDAADLVAVGEDGLQVLGGGVAHLGVGAGVGAGGGRLLAALRHLLEGSMDSL